MPRVNVGLLLFFNFESIYFSLGRISARNSNPNWVPFYSRAKLVTRERVIVLTFVDNPQHITRLSHLYGNPHISVHGVLPLLPAPTLGCTISHKGVSISVFNQPGNHAPGCCYFFVLMG